MFLHDENTHTRTHIQEPEKNSVLRTKGAIWRSISNIHACIYWPRDPCALNATHLLVIKTFCSFALYNTASDAESDFRRQTAAEKISSSLRQRGEEKFWCCWVIASKGPICSPQNERRQPYYFPNSTNFIGACCVLFCQIKYLWLIAAKLLFMAAIRSIAYQWPTTLQHAIHRNIGLGNTYKLVWFILYPHSERTRKLRQLVNLQPWC